MVSQRLRKELAVLIHHVELNKAGWLDKAAKQLIIFATWVVEDSVTPEGIRELLWNELGVTAEQSRMLVLVEDMCRAGVLVDCGGGAVKLSETWLRKYEEQIAEWERIEESVRCRFGRILAICCPGVDAESAWDHFVNNLLYPLTREEGARLYELVSGRNVNVTATASFESFLSQYEPEVQSAVRNAVISFLDPRDADVRTYVLRHLNAYFFQVATNMPQDALDDLSAAARKRPSFKLFLDTNFLFSVLGIHENPSNDAAQSLVQLVRHVGRYVEVKLYVLPVTLEELRRALSRQIDTLKGLRLTKNLAEAATDAGLTGIARKYVEECGRTGIALPAEEYFQPFVSDLVSVLKSKGIVTYNGDFDGYATRQDVVDDILDQQEHEKRYHPEHPKTYEELQHDLVLWHFTQDRRPALVESPLGAQYWTVTLDFRLLGFDRHKQKAHPERIPICLHPAALIQLLQFWIAATDEFESAMLGTLRLPFLFQDFDPEAERTTISILKTLTYFENSEEITADTAHRILMNRALRQKIRPEMGIDAQIELVREALVDVDQLRAKELQDARTEAERWKVAAEENAAEAAVLSSRLNAIGEQSRESMDDFVKARAALELRVSGLEVELAKKSKAEEMLRMVARFRQQLLALFMAGLAVITLFVGLNSYLGSRHLLLNSGGAVAFVLFCLLWAADRISRRNKELRQTVLSRVIEWLWRWLRWITASVALTVLGNYIYAKLAEPVL